MATKKSKSKSKSKRPIPTTSTPLKPKNPLPALDTVALTSSKNTTLLSYILSFTWLSPLSIEDRLCLLRGAPLVSRGFRDEFARVMFKNPYFLSSSFYTWFLDFVQSSKESHVFPAEFKAYATEHLTSLTFICEEGKKRKYPRYDAVPYMRRDHLAGLFQRLTRVKVEYLNTTFWDPTTEWWVFFLPDTVDTLEVRYTTDPTRRSHTQKEPRITSFASGPYLHYTRVPDKIKHLTVYTTPKGPITKENVFRLAALFPSLISLHWNNDEIPLANGPVDMKMFEKLRALPKTGPERDAGIRYFAINVARFMFQGGDKAFSDTLKMLAREEPEVFAQETARMAAEGRLPKLVAALKAMEDDGLFTK